MLLEERQSRVQSGPVTLATNSVHYGIFFFLHFFLFVSFNPSLPFRIPCPHTHSLRFIYFQSVSFSLLHSFSLQLAEIIGGQLLR